jgi:hypothetical protein
MPTVPLASETEDLFEMANLFPATTGLPMTVWVSPRGIIAGRRAVDDERAVSRWVSLNEAALVAYWNGQIDTIQLGRLLQPLPPTP